MSNRLKCGQCNWSGPLSGTGDGQIFRPHSIKHYRSCPKCGHEFMEFTKIVEKQMSQILNYNITYLAEDFPTEPPEGFRSDTFDWRACEAVARTLHRLAYHETDVNVVRLGMPPDADMHKIMHAATIACLILEKVTRPIDSSGKYGALMEHARKLYAEWNDDQSRTVEALIAAVTAVTLANDELLTALENACLAIEATHPFSARDYRAVIAKWRDKS